MRNKNIPFSIASISSASSTTSSISDFQTSFQKFSRLKKKKPLDQFSLMSRCRWQWLSIWAISLGGKNKFKVGLFILHPKNALCITESVECHRATIEDTDWSLSLSPRQHRPMIAIFITHLSAPPFFLIWTKRSRSTKQVFVWNWFGPAEWHALIKIN